MECKRRWLNQSTQAIVVNSTSPRCLSGPVWNGPGRMASVLNSPMIDSIRALSEASPTVPIDAAIPSSARCSVYLRAVRPCVGVRDEVAAGDRVPLLAT